MGLFDKAFNREKKEVKLSAELAKKLDALKARWPQIQEEWTRQDEANVRPLAQELATTLLTDNGERILAAREALKRSIWQRDDVKGVHEREVIELSCELEIMTGPIIFKKVQEWQTDLAGLQNHKVVEIGERFADLSKESTPKMIAYRSNGRMLKLAKDQLLDGIRQLRELRQRPLSEIYAFIESTETNLRKIDLTALSEEPPVSQSRFREIADGDDLQILPDRSNPTRQIERHFRP